MKASWKRRRFRRPLACVVGLPRGPYSTPVLCNLQPGAVVVGRPTPDRLRQRSRGLVLSRVRGGRRRGSVERERGLKLSRSHHARTYCTTVQVKFSVSNLSRNFFARITTTTTGTMRRPALRRAAAAAPSRSTSSRRCKSPSTAGTARRRSSN